MTREQMVKEIVSLYTQSLNPKSKWYKSDLFEFKVILATKSEKELQQQLANMRGIMGYDERVNRAIAAEEKRLERAGMYNIGNMKPNNALD